MDWVSADSRAIYIEWLSSNYRASVDQPLTECQPITGQYIGQVSTTIGKVSVKWQWSIIELKAISADIHHDLYITDCLTTIYRVSKAISTNIAINISVDTTYSKDDPKFGLSLLPLLWDSDVTWNVIGSWYAVTAMIQ